ncbi:N/A [soil metagenome]
MKDRNGNQLTMTQIMRKVVVRMISILLELEILMLHVVGNVPSHLFRRFFYRLAGVRIGEGSTLHMGIKFYEPSNITIGKDTIIGEGTVLDGREKISIGDHVDIASEVMIYNAEHNVQDEHFSAIEEKVVIEDYVFIGPRAIILPGITIGKGAVVGAGAVVTKDVAPFCIVGGVPAKHISERKPKDLRYRLGRARWFR